MKKGTLSRFLPYYKPHLFMLALDMLCASILVGCDVALPVIVSYLTDTAVNDITKITTALILKVGAVYLALRIIDVAANFFVQTGGHFIGTKIETRMRSDMFAHLQGLSFNYYSNTKIGQIMSRITTDLFDVTEFAHHCPEMVVTAALKIIVSAVILCGYNKKLAIAIFVFVPFLFVVFMIFRNKMKSAFKLQRSQLGEINAKVEDSLQGIRVVKSFANEELEKAKFEKDNKRFLKVKKRAYYFMGGFHCCTRFFDGIIYLLVSMYGIYLMTKGELTVGNFTASLLFVSTIMTSIRTIMDFNEQFQRGITGIERFFEIMDEPVEQDLPNAKELDTVKGGISFKNVSFRYEDSEGFVLNNLNINIPQGKNIAIVGASGGGKTTFCNLIPRFYDIDGGEITLDGENIKNIKLSSLRKNIGIVQQDVYLFSGTVKENISYGDPNKSDEEIIEAAKNADAHEFIMRLKDGYDTYIGERGVKLSGGQKQRISISRVFLKDPAVLILDEATSALDNETERVIQASLEKLCKGRTTVTIAHRLSTVRNADEIIVLSENGILERGTHSELMSKKGVYYKMAQAASD